MVTRPKSIATVVVVFSVPGSSLSIWVAAAVIHDSVLIGGISEMAPTAVVLPTPNPPAMTILAEVIDRCCGTSGELEEAGTKSLQKCDVVGWAYIGGSVVVQDQLVGLEQVADQHPGHAERQAAVGGQLGDRAHGLRRLVEPARRRGQG